jgi:hypothetical protein
MMAKKNAVAGQHRTTAQRDDNQTGNKTIGPPRRREVDGNRSSRLGNKSSSPGEQVRGSSLSPEYDDLLDAILAPPNGSLGPTDPPRLDHDDPEALEDKLNRVQGLAYALYRAALLTWMRLGFPDELKEPMRLLMRAAERATVPSDAWIEAVMKFFPAPPPDWGMP